MGARGCLSRAPTPDARGSCPRVGFTPLVRGYVIILSLLVIKSSANCQFLVS
jgi:hypothetical protein